MTPNTRKIVSFGLLLIPLFLVFLGIYLWVFPVYNTAVTETANFVTKRMSPPTYLEMRRSWGGGWRGYAFTDEKGQIFIRAWTNPTAHLMYISMVILPALLLATPAPIKTRFKLLAIAIPLLFASHLLSVVLLMRTTFCLNQTPGTFSCLWALRFAYSSGQFFAGIFWVFMTWRYWFSGLLAVRRAGPNTESG
jgi:hypothetical protein